jgi:predicted lipoprotein with Yx(FWY)xxD motif
LGPILIDSQGRTLYLWQADTGAKSTCIGACAAAWPPLVTTGKPTAGSGVTSSLLGTTKRANGTEQVTYNGHPLYLFAGDTASRQTNGQGSNGVGAPWYVLSPQGNPLTGATASTASSPPTGY